MQNIALSAPFRCPSLTAPGVRFASPSATSHSWSRWRLFGGGASSPCPERRGHQQIEAAIEFGGNISLNLGVASGGVYVMAGIYFGMTGTRSAHRLPALRGYLEVLGLISISVESTWDSPIATRAAIRDEVWGQASVKEFVKVLWSARVSSSPLSAKVCRRCAPSIQPSNA